nr:hypothetical protein [Tanacetum cinerariifolium]
MAKEQRRRERKWDDVIANQDLDDKDEDNNNDGIILTGAIYLLVMVRIRMEVPIKSFRDYKACLHSYMVMKNVKRLNDTLCHGLTVEHNKEEEGRNMSSLERGVIFLTSRYIIIPIKTRNNADDLLEWEGVFLYDEDNNNDGIILTGAIYVALLAVALGHGSYLDGSSY